MTLHGAAADYLEGRLSAEEERAFLTHLVDCQTCEAALADEIQLCEREESYRARARADLEPPAPSTGRGPAGPRRRRT